MDPGWIQPEMDGSTRKTYEKRGTSRWILDGSMMDPLVFTVFWARGQNGDPAGLLWALRGVFLVVSANWKSDSFLSESDSYGLQLPIG